LNKPGFVRTFPGPAAEKAAPHATLLRGPGLPSLAAEELRAMDFAEEMEELIRREGRHSLEELAALWVGAEGLSGFSHHCPAQVEMGLSKKEIEDRLKTVSAKVRSVTAEMVGCDKENRDKIARKVSEQQKVILALRQELKVGEGNVDLAPSISLIEQNKILNKEVNKLRQMKTEALAKFR
jgi:hypothetical protein